MSPGKQASGSETAAPMAAGARLEAMRRRVRLFTPGALDRHRGRPRRPGRRHHLHPDHGRHGRRSQAHRRAHHGARRRPGRLCAAVRQRVAAQQRGRHHECAGAACAVDGAGRRTARPGRGYALEASVRDRGAQCAARGRHLVGGGGCAIRRRIGAVLRRPGGRGPRRRLVHGDRCARRGRRPGPGRGADAAVRRDRPGG